MTPNNYNMYGMLIMLIRGVLANEIKVNELVESSNLDQFSGLNLHKQYATKWKYLKLISHK